jgi:hypothetical protein
VWTRKQASAWRGGRNWTVRSIILRPRRHYGGIEVTKKGGTAVRKETRYYHELEDGREVELPFDTEGADITEVHKDGKIILGCLVRDESPEDPFEAFDDGEFWQFNRRYKHDTRRPYPEDFKDVIRTDRRWVFYVHARQDGYFAGDRALIKNAEEIEDADGYYIVPEDVPAGQRASYAKSVIDQYSAWCEGDVWGVCVWAYEEKTLHLLDREETWGVYGWEYAESDLKEQLKEIKE